MLNKQGPGKIDWCDWSWNPISGCRHGCDYCYLKRLDARYKKGFMIPSWHPDRLNDLKKANSGDKVFVSSTGDMFGEWVESYKIKIVLDAVSTRPDLIFQFLTKNPKRYTEFEFPKNCWLGVTIDGKNFNDDRTPIQGPHVLERALYHKHNITFISFEPLLCEITEYIKLFINRHYVDWIIIGANSNPGADRPKVEWAQDIISKSREGAEKVWIWTKDNFKELEQIKEFPENRYAEKHR